ncbi:MAG: HlyD family efflux transporter periplasmic adaptor subunit [Bacteroidota bacterium]
MAALALPDLRDELAVLPGPAADDGSPTWTLHDPLANRYFRLPWPVFEVLSRWHLKEPQAVVEAVGRETTLNLEIDDVMGVVEFMARSQLLKAVTSQDVNRLIKQYDASKTSWATWLLHHYLFFRIPLVRPNQMLDALLPTVRWLGGTAFRWATLAALVFGLFFVVRQWDSFRTTFVDNLSATGLVAFGIALGFAKVVHELGHALTAKSYGLRVPTMGVAFLVMMPVLYTDVNEAWTLTERRRRLMVGGAGILSELTIAAWATLAWGLLPDGTARAMAFTLATTTWISSLVINLSPFMRFDGYFLAMDALNQPNLHPRSFALARWHLREFLFDLGEPVPEVLSPWTRGWMIAFAWAVWIYRLLLFLGIAVLVYHFFIKVVGILLFAVEMGWFVLRPFWMEFTEWGKRYAVIRTRSRSRWPLAVLVLAVLVAVLPWNGRVSAPAMLKAERHALVYAPAPAQLVEILVEQGQEVTAGAVVARLDNPDLEHRLAMTARRIGTLKYELSSIGFEDTFRNRAKAIAEELEGAIAEQAALQADQRRLELLAPLTGALGDLSPALQPGQWISPHDPLLSVGAGAQVEAYVAETDLPYLAVGDEAAFIPESRAARITARVAAIDRVAVSTLTEPSLAVPYGGSIPARFSDKALIPDTAVYRVRLTLDGVKSVAVPLRGQVHIAGIRRSLLGHAFQSVAAILIREWGM